MTALWILLGIFLFFFTLFHIPIHVRVGIAEEVFVFLKILFLKIPILPKPKKARKKKKKKKKKSDKKKAPEKKKEQKKQGKDKKKKSEKDGEKPKKKLNILGLVRMLLRVLKAFFKKFGKHFKVRIYAYELTVATGDAAKTATMYGAVSMASANIFALLERTRSFKIMKNAPCQVYADFCGEKSKAHVEIDMSLTIHGVLAMVFAAGFAFVKALPLLKTKEKKEEKAAKDGKDDSKDTKDASEEKTEAPSKKLTKNQNG
ncbi:MAG: DUF2953 domain-containing protein [Clostridia bacterium]|nr:DUF2953 domain-containing protein [Clostridia bacterium]